MEPLAPNLLDYAAERARFSWAGARARLEGCPAGGLNIAHEAVDRHARGADALRVAIRWRGAQGERRDLSFGELSLASNRFANALLGLGLSPGDRVFMLLPRVPELYIAVMGALKAQAVICSLFSAFGPDPIRQRLSLGGGRVLVTTATLYAKKVAPIRAELPELQHVIFVGGEGPDHFDTLCAAASDHYTIPATPPDTPALLHFTSGTTGKPKGALHVHEAVVHHHASAYYALDLHPGDIFWCTADPGWVTGTSYGIIAPLVHGITSVVYDGDFDAVVWYRLLREESVSVWYTAPTAVRMMMRAGTELAREQAFPALRFIASVGEPLNPEAVRWGREAFGFPIHDNWWQTETGGILVANFAGAEIRPGSMGRPLPGIEAAVMRRTESGVEPVARGEQGELAIRVGWPSMFRAYLGDPERYARCFADDWYMSGDVVRVDDDGYYWFVGRADDVIKTAGHLVGPFEVESVLMEHPAVAEAAAVGLPDPLAGETIKAYVALKPGHPPDEATRRSILGHARVRLGVAIAPREIAFVPGLPKTRSGKILRRLLRARELGLPEGDTSTLEAS